MADFGVPGRNRLNVLGAARGASNMFEGDMGDVPEILGELSEQHRLGPALITDDVAALGGLRVTTTTREQHPRTQRRQGTEAQKRGSPRQASIEGRRRVRSMA